MVLEVVAVEAHMLASASQCSMVTELLTSLVGGATEHVLDV